MAARRKPDSWQELAVTPELLAQGGPIVIVHSDQKCPDLCGGMHATYGQEFWPVPGYPASEEFFPHTYHAASELSDITLLYQLKWNPEVWGFRLRCHGQRGCVHWDNRAAAKAELDLSPQCNPFWYLTWLPDNPLPWQGYARLSAQHLVFGVQDYGPPPGLELTALTPL